MAHYSCGMYGGSFNPLHLGHVRCMISAANQCDKLIVVISNGVNRNEIDIRQRYRWVYETVKHFPHVRIQIFVSILQIVDKVVSAIAGAILF